MQKHSRTEIVREKLHKIPDLKRQPQLIAKERVTEIGLTVSRSEFVCKTPKSF
jgi:hypothetical protein